MYLVFDTETTGKANFDLPPEHESQPRLVQLGAQLLDEGFVVRAEMNMIVKPSGYTIPEGAANVHGIKTELAEQFGYPEDLVLGQFAVLCTKATVLVAHNLQFDGLIMGRAFSVNPVPVVLPTTKRCTMHEMTEVCKLPGRMGNYKWPSLQEAYAKATNGGTFEGAHDAMADVRACARILRFLVKGPEQPSMERVPEEEYTAETLMPFGKHKGIPLGKVDPSYLQWLRGQCPLTNELLNRYLKSRFK